MPDEKTDEKQEKEVEKRDEKAPDEKWRRDPLGAIIWACILIWAGVVFLLDQLGYLDSIQDLLYQRQAEWMIGFPGEFSTWGLVFLGAGVILLFEVLIRLVVPAYRRSVTGTIILAFVFIGIGLGNVISWQLIIALILIAAGLSIVIGGLTRRR
jgi:vacuolar-type H+-ATPase subunit I/STV1